MIALHNGMLRCSFLQVPLGENCWTYKVSFHVAYGVMDGTVNHPFKRYGVFIKLFGHGRWICIKVWTPAVAQYCINTDSMIEPQL